MGSNSLDITTVGVYINTMKTTFLLSLTSKKLFHVTSLQVNKEKLLIDSVFPCLYVSMMVELVEIKIKNKNCVHCIDIYDDDRIYRLRINQLSLSNTKGFFLIYALIYEQR